MAGRVRRSIRLLPVLCLALLAGGCTLSSTEPGGPSAPGADDTSAPEPTKENGGDSSSQAGSPRSVPPAISLEPAALNVPEGGSGRYAVGLSAAPSSTVTVTVTVSAASAELTVAPAQLAFTAGDWRTEQTVTVSAAEDADAVADAAGEVLHTARGGGYDGAAAAALTVLIVENDVSALAVTGGRAGEGSGTIGFEVSLSVAATRTVTVAYATGAEGDDAVAGRDYEQAGGTLTFAAGSTEARTIAVVVHDDALDEDDERVTVTLSDAAGAVLAGGETTVTAAGVIEDDDPQPELRVADASVTEGGGDLQFTVTLAPASGRTVTVDYATGDGTGDAAATAGEDYREAAGTLTYAAGTTAQTISVPIPDDAAAEETETFTVTLSNATASTLAAATATGSIANDDPLQLDSLQVAGGGTMYPAFDPAIHHYALTCGDSTTLQVTAGAVRAATSLTLLRADSAQNQVASGAMSVTGLVVDEDHDIAIELSETGAATVTYVVHCIPADYPDVTIVTNSGAAAEEMLLVTPTYTRESDSEKITYLAVVDYNGVPRFHRSVRPNNKNLRAFQDGPVIEGKTVRYSYNNPGGEVVLLDGDFARIKGVSTVEGISNTNGHDFLITEDDTFLFISYHDAVRDFSTFKDHVGDPYPADRAVKDSVIQEVDQAGNQRFLWNSWDHLQIDPDCRGDSGLGTEYAHLNAFQEIEGDIIASFARCKQVLRIDRSSDPATVEWKLGGSAPAQDSGTVHFAIVGDPHAGVCRIHQPILNDSGSLVLFDNGDYCVGDRKRISRVLEYDISTGTEAVFVRHYEHPHELVVGIGGSLAVLDNGNWLIAWGGSPPKAATSSNHVSISEVDAAGTAHFEMLWHKGADLGGTYRVYLEDESSVTVPLNLP